MPQITVTRKIKESPFYVGRSEVIPYTLDFAGFVPTAVTTLTSAAVALYDITTGEPGTDVSSTALSGTPTFSNLVLTLPTINVDQGKKYRLFCRGTGGGGTYELWADVFGEW